MKYKDGDKTVFGEITDHYKEIGGGWVYYIGGRLERSWFTESEIDAIIIKPKRNIDHLIELWESGSTAAKVREFMCEKRLSTLAEKIDIQKWLAPYTEPFSYPKLTPEELKAAKWLVEGGFIFLDRKAGTTRAHERSTCGANIVVAMYSVTCQLIDSRWITESPINLAELLAAQEGL